MDDMYLSAVQGFTDQIIGIYERYVFISPIVIFWTICLWTVQASKGGMYL